MLEDPKHQKPGEIPKPIESVPGNHTSPETLAERLWDQIIKDAQLLAPFDQKQDTKNLFEILFDEIAHPLSNEDIVKAATLTGANFAMGLASAFAEGEGSTSNEEREQELQAKADQQQEQLQQQQERLDQQQQQLEQQTDT